MRILISGASSLPGFLVSKLLVEKGYEVVGLYFNNHVSMDRDGFTGLKIDIRDYTGLKRVFDRFRPSAVLHFAAYGDVDGCERDNGYAWSVNVDGTSNLLNLASKYSEYFLYLSTDYVFKGDRGWFKEDDIPNPVNYYGLTKMVGEVLTKSSMVRWCILRASSIYGLGPGRKNFAKFLIESLGSGKKVRAITDQYTTPTYAGFLAEAVYHALDRRVVGVYHIVSSIRLSRYEFALRLAEYLGLPHELIEPASMDDFNWFAPRPRDSSLDSRESQKIFGESLFSFEGALQRLKKEYSEYINS